MAGAARFVTPVGRDDVVPETRFVAVAEFVAGAESLTGRGGLNAGPPLRLPDALGGMFL